MVAKDGVPRRRWSLAEKRRIVELTLGGGATTRAIAHKHGVHPQNLYQWRALYRTGKLDAQPTSRVRAATQAATFLPVTVVRSAVGTLPRAIRRRDEDARGGVVELTLASGDTLRLESADLDAALLCAIVSELRR